ncbi:MAG: tetratricopeptide repeat protein, partial [Gammaproteobacteria bacterium]
MTEATACYNRDDIPAAERLCRRALTLFADFPQALHLLGLCLWRQDQWDAAIAALGRAASVNPKEAQVFHDIGLVYSLQGEWPRAIHAYQRAIELRPSFAESYLYLGGAYESTGEHGEAERAYRKALELNSASATAAGSLAAVYEAGNRLEEAAQLVAQALRADPSDAVANLTQAQLDFRDGQPRQTIQRLKALLQQPLTPRNRSLGLSRLGAAYEQVEDYGHAFAAFADSKQVLLDAGNPATGPGVYTLESAQRIAHHLPVLMAETPEVVRAAEAAPVFLVGFPRSGTTLLDQILSSHPRLSVLEEKENLQDLLRDFVTTDTGLEH